MPLRPPLWRWRGRQHRCATTPDGHGGTAVPPPVGGRASRQAPLAAYQCTTASERESRREKRKMSRLPFVRERKTKEESRAGPASALTNSSSALQRCLELRSRVRARRGQSGQPPIDNGMPEQLRLTTLRTTRPAPRDLTELSPASLPPLRRRLHTASSAAGRVAADADLDGKHLKEMRNAAAPEGRAGATTRRKTKRIKIRRRGGGTLRGTSRIGEDGGGGREEQLTEEQ